MKTKIAHAILFIVSLFIVNTVNAQTWNLAGNSNATAASLLGTTNNIPLRLFTNNAEQVHINANTAGKVGFVGLGTTAPATRLDVNGVITATGGNSTNWNLAYTRIGSNTTNYVPKWNGTAFVKGIIFDNATNVGISTASPAAKLNIKGTSNNFQLIVDAYSTQSNTKPLIKLRRSNGTDLMWIHSDSSDNVFIGVNCGRVNNAANGGTANTFIGKDAGYSNSSGNSNTATGMNALRSNTTGVGNTATGMDALRTNTSATYSTANGMGALHDNMGSYNTATGAFTLYTNTTGHSNTAIGNNALEFNTQGVENTSTGMNSMVTNTTGNANTANGYEALYSNSTGGANTAVGHRALFSNSIGTNNTAVGAGALLDNDDGVLNTAVGDGALLYSNGDFNTAVGVSALLGTTTAGGNTAIGFFAGRLFNPGSSNTFIGYQANMNANGFFNSTALGAATTITASDQVRIGSGVTSIGGPQDWSNTSDARIKENIRDDVHGLDFITRLKPVTYTKSLEKETQILGKDSENNITEPGMYEKIRYSGFLAQEVEQAANDIGYDFSGVDAPKNDKDLYSLRYATFVVPLVKAVQELNSANAELKTQNAELKKEMQQMKSVLSDELQQRLTELQKTKATLEQNIPNPFNKSTVIKYFVPDNFNDSQIKIYSSQGVEMKTYSIKQNGKGELTVEANSLGAGIYSYTLIVGNYAADVKQMIVTR